jgi:hypothetical protein
MVYTDGIDTIGWTSPADTIATAARSDAVIYAVVPRKREQFRAPLLLGEYKTMGAFLTALTEVTSGALLEADSERLPRTFAKIVQDFAQGYQLVFYPKGVEKKGWHALQVRLKGKRGTVRARRGYYAN